MNFENFLEKKLKSKNAKSSYMQALKKLNLFLKNDEFIHGGAYLDDVELILTQELDWKYDKENRKLYAYKEKLETQNSFLENFESVENLSIENLKKLKKMIAVDGNQILRGISKADGNGAISAAIEKLIEWKESGDLKILQLEFWNELRKIYLDNKILKQHENGVDIKFNEEYHIYIVNINSRNLLTIKLYIPENKELFESFKSKKYDIEKEIGTKLEWSLKNSKATTISRSFEFDIEKRETWEFMLKILSKEITKFINIFGKYKNDLNTSKNLHNVKGGKMEYQRIVYGAPGTGKSYMLKKESGDETFPQVVISREEVIDLNQDIDIENRNYWLVGAFWGSENMFDKFVNNGYWENGYDDKFLDKVNEIKIGDYIGIKTLNRYTNETIVKALGIVTNNHNNGKKIDVDWIVKDEKAYPKRRYNMTIHKISENRLDMFNSLVEIEKNKGKEVKKIEKIINTVERVTFYDGYTYGQFVGTYKPVPSDENKENIIYKYIPGPFMTTLVKALKNPTHKFLLIIEEINRAKADRVFGNIFQLLDRDDNGNSEYPINISSELEKYLKEEFEDEEEYQNHFKNGLFLPNNFYIWATMNNADQGVYPLDTAFKRRWNFEYVGLNDNEDEFGNKNYRVKLSFEKGKENNEELKYPIEGVEWSKFRNTLNNFLLDNDIYEDRLIAPFFVKEKEFIEDKNKDVDVYWISDSVYINKLMMYIFDDVLKHKTRVRKGLFKEEIKSFSNLIKEYYEGKCIYSGNFLEKLRSEEKGEK